MNERAVEGQPPLTLMRHEVMRHLRIRSRSTLDEMIRRGDCPDPDFYISRSPRWHTPKFEAWLAGRVRAAEEGRNAL